MNNLKIFWQTVEYRWVIIPIFISFISIVAVNLFYNETSSISIHNVQYYPFSQMLSAMIAYAGLIPAFFVALSLIVKKVNEIEKARYLVENPPNREGNDYKI
jgi:hypothetical protein